MGDPEPGEVGHKETEKKAAASSAPLLVWATCLCGISWGAAVSDVHDTSINCTQ